ncbi:MAG: WecB/TagA/CpsF family glycosyltransferase [Planctomycetes bacterium]|nr:WecB/TagA/CpsF family glycosyltransferase [Planctomycetota bacterium]MCB9889222.1 WecB/TagA/CpsF family glycosyltransferase [Planctomycetota bacterium]
MAQMVELCAAAVRREQRLVVGAVNAAKVVKMRRDPELAAAVRGCDVVIADGASLVWASRILRQPLPERVAGIDLFTELLARAERDGSSVYLLGATAEVQKGLRAELDRRHPDLVIAGARDGYFAAEQAGEVAAAVRASGADYLFVGMGTPRKELFLARWAAETGAAVVHGVGGSFDVVSGLVRRAPRIWQKLGLEWLYRVCQEPRRLWRRYLVTNTVFLVWLAGAWLRGLWPRRR